jgi:predicted transcriptional regulator
MYVDILEILGHSSPLKLTHIMNEANVNCCMLREYLDYLTEQGLVKKKTVGKERKVYEITQLGLTVLNEFRELKEVFSSVEEKETEKQFIESCQVELNQL